VTVVFCFNYNTFFLECGPPPILNDGTYTPVAPYYFEGQTVTYSCNSDTLIGIDTNTCQEDGSWSNPAPMCSDQGIYWDFLILARHLTGLPLPLSG